MPAVPSAADVTIADFDYAPDPVEVAVGGTVMAGTVVVGAP